MTGYILVAAVLLLGSSSVLAKPQYSGGTGGDIEAPADCSIVGWGCVPFTQCDDNLEIITDGGLGLLVARIPVKTCPGTQICCRDTEYIPVVPDCNQYEECVPGIQCDGNGYIVTDGSGLLDQRIGPAKCNHPDFYDIDTYCCKVPDAPLDFCLNGYECVHDCDGLGTPYGGGGTGGTDVCWINGYGNNVGICCAPKVNLVDCPIPSACTALDTCTGHQAMDFNLQPVTLPYTGELALCGDYNNPGVCCIIPPPPKIVECPLDSSCTLYESCINYQAMNYETQLVSLPYTGELLQCGDVYNPGVCCYIPPPPPVYPVASECGVLNNLVDTRITNAYGNIYDAGFGEFPWMAIIFGANYTYKCGAGLITNRFVITAGHCVYGEQAGHLKVRLGEWQVNTFDEPLKYKDVGVIYVSIPVEYNHRRANFQNDLAILELEQEVNYDFHINTVCLPYDQHQVFFTPDRSETCFVTGWGKDTFDGHYQNVLKKVNVPIVPPAVCQENLRHKDRLGSFFRLDPTILCAGGDEGVDACKGDGGGPLVCKDQITGRYTLAGIVAASLHGSCGVKDVPGLYANVAEMLPWIQQVLYERNTVYEELLATLQG